MTGSPPDSPPAGPPPPEASARPPRGGLRDALRTRRAHAQGVVSDYVRRHRALLWPVVPLLLLCVLSAPLLGAWMRWVELPRIVREEALQPCAPMAAGASEDAVNASLDARHAALAPPRCAGMRRIDRTGLRTAAYRFEDGSLFTLHLRTPPATAVDDDAAFDAALDAVIDAAADAGTDTDAGPGSADIDAGIAIDPADQDDADLAPSDTQTAPPAPPPILTAHCPVQSRQSLLVLAGLLMVGVVVVLHRLRAGGKFFDFRQMVSEPLRPGEVLLLVYAFTLIAGTGIGLQLGGCEAAEHRDAVRVEQAPTSLNELIVPKGP